MPVEPTPGQPQKGAEPPAHNRAVARRGAGAAPPGLTANLNALALLKALRRRWPLALGVGLLLALAAAPTAWFLVPPSKHTVRTLIHVPPNKPWLLRTVDGVPDLPNHQRTQVALMKSRLVLSAALADKEVRALPTVAEQVDAVEWLEKEVQADFSVAPEILRIAISGDRADDLVKLVNALREAYLREIVEREANLRQEKLNALREMREGYDTRLKASREQQRLIEQKAGAKDAGVRALMLGLLQQQQALAEREFLQAKASLEKAKVQLAADEARLKKFDELPVPPVKVDKEVDQQLAVQELLRKAKKLQQDVAVDVKRATLGAQDPAVKELQGQQAAAEESLQALREKLRPEAVRKVRDEERAVLSARVSELQSKVEVLEKTVKFFEEDAARLANLIQKKVGHGAELDAFRENLVQVEELTKRIANEEMALEVELKAPKREQVLEKAVVTHARSKTRKYMLTLGAAAAGLALGLLAVAFLELRAQRVDTVEEVAQSLGLPVVGALPDSSRPVPRRRLPEGITAEAYTQAVLTESVDATRAMLVHAARTEGVQVVMITSAMPGEGKTSLSCHLAASLARVGHKTLLIDGDMRNPMAHRLFELPNGAGLSEVLRGEAAAEQVTQPTVLPSLSLIAGGHWDGGAAAGLAQGGARALFDRLRQEYDFILVDSSPVLPVADALLVGQSADAVVFSILRDVSRLPNVYLASQRLAAMGARTLGAVLNGVPGGLYVSSYTYAAVGQAPAQAG